MAEPRERSFVDDLLEILNFIEGRSLTCSQNDIEYIQDKLDWSIHSLQLTENNLIQINSAENNQHLQDIVVMLQNFRYLKFIWDKVKVSSPSTITQVGCVQTCVVQGPGRPHFIIDVTQILYLCNIGFKIKDVAKMFGVDRTTVWRRLKQFNLVGQQYSDISDDDLLNQVKHIYENHPHCGVTMMSGHLNAVGIKVQNRRVRLALRRVDPWSSVHRWGLTAQRRRYHVPGPNSLWHIDGHHALIRWKMVTHGGIDGYSRLIVYLKVSNNNRAETVLDLFKEAVQTYGLPSRVRGDNGTENNLVERYMIFMKGESRGSFIRGRSVHNTRIERLWRDVYYAVIQTYYALFYYLESIGLLDVDNELDMCCLQFVFLPRINEALNQFLSAYNNHKLRTEHNWTPMQMWVNGTIHRTWIEESRTEFDTYGIDPGVTSEHSEDSQDMTEGYLDNEDVLQQHNVLQNLSEQFNPLGQSDDYGINIYQSVHQFCRAHMSE